MGLARVQGACVAVAVVVLAGMAVACGQDGQDGQDGGDATPGTTSDVHALVAASGGKVLAARTFRATVENRGLHPALSKCGRTTTVDVAIDLDRKLAFYELEPGRGTELILTPETLYVRSSALAGSTVDRPWLSVPFGDAANLGSVRLALRTGLMFSAKSWNLSSDGSSPLSALAAMKEAATKVDGRGPEVVRGVDTTRFDLTIDPSRAGAWVGRTTTSAGTPPTTLSPDAVRAARERLIGRFGESLPDEVRAAFLDGDVQPMIEHFERTEGMAMSEAQRAVLHAMVSGDGDAYLRATEALSGTSMPPNQRSLMHAQLTGSSDLESVGGQSNAFTAVRATVWVDEDGTLRRIDQRVEVDRNGAVPAIVEPDLDARLEISDLGAPITETLPADAEVRRSADLRSGDLPARVPPCDK
jgi:hypothetical protein